MPETRVQDEQGTVHVFPDGSTPEMIATALGVKPPVPPASQALSSITSGKPNLPGMIQRDESNARLAGVPGGSPNTPPATPTMAKIAGAGIGAAALGTPGVLPFLGAQAANVAKAVPPLAMMAGIGWLRKQIPAIPPIAEYLPMFMRFGGKPNPSAESEALPPASNDQIPGRPYAPNPRYEPPPPEPQPIAPRKGPLLLEGAVNPGASLPARPSPELMQSRSLSEPGAAPPPEPSAGLGKLPFIPKPAAKLPAAFESPEPSYSSPTGTVENPDTSPTPSRTELPFIPKPTVADIGNKVESSLGGKPLAPNVPLRQQMPATRTALEGHTPVTSSALSSYKYDPTAREFHAVSGNTHYVYGDVSPEDAQAFEQAESKGKAWQAIIRSNPLVRKNGKPVIPAQ